MIANALFADNSASDYGGALYFSGYGSAEIRQGTFVNNHAPDQHGGGAYHQAFTKYDEHGFPFQVSGRSFFYNSILWDNPGGEAIGLGAFASWDPAVNCVRGWTGPSLLACAVGTTPFVDPGAGDYQLYPGSSAIDQGLDSAATDLPVDLDGRPRVMGAHVDLGCYEREP